MHFQGGKLGKIGSALGTPLVNDECTKNKLRVSYAHISVEVDITQYLYKDINIKDMKGKCMKQPVEYEWKPFFCEKFQKVGHNCTTRPQMKTTK